MPGHRKNPDTPRKITIVYLADKVLEKGPIPGFKAQQLTEQVLHQQIVNDPAFRAVVIGNLRRQKWIFRISGRPT
jgi:hypothetical protein